MITLFRLKDRFILAQDSFIDVEGCINTNDRERDYTILTDEESGVTIAVDQSQRYFDNIKYVTDLNLPIGKRRLTPEYIVREFMPRLNKSLVENNFMNGRIYPKYEGEIMLIKGKDAFLILDNGAIMEIGNTECIGQGSTVACGVIKALYKGEHPKEDMLNIYKHTRETSHKVGDHILILDTKTKEETIEVIR